jgi:iron complex outermembrane receptor protein
MKTYFGRNYAKVFELALGCALLIFSQSVAASTLRAPQNAAGTISGRVTDPQGAVIAGARVTAVHTRTGERSSAQTDSQGDFKLSNLAAGLYRVEILTAGFASAAKEVQVGTGESVTADFQLSVGPVTESVTTRAETYQVTVAATATKIDAPIFDIPQSIQVVNRKLLDDQQVVALAEVGRNVSGVTRASTDFNGSTPNEFVIRGFTLDFTNNYLKDGFRFEADMPSETVHIERVEFLKGPGSVIYGRGEPGGLVNVVTKKPLEEPLISAQLTGGSFGILRPQFDLSGPLNSGKTLLYRVNGVYERVGSFRDFVEGDRFFIAPVITWKIGPRTALSLSGEYLRDERVADFGQVPIGNRPADVPVERFYGEPFNRVYVQERQFQYRFDHAFNSNWSLHNGYRALLINWNLFEVFQDFTPVAADGRTVNRLIADVSLPRRWQATETYVTGRFDTGSVQHNVVMGMDYSDQRAISRGPFGRFYPSIDVFNPVYQNDLAAANRFLAEPGSFFNGDTILKPLGAYVQDQITLTEKVKALAGVRFDHYRQNRINRNAQTESKTSDFAASPRVGLVYQPAEAVSLYFSYGRSFSPPFPTLRNQNDQPFDPERSAQYEAGVKASNFNGRLLTTLSVYHLEKRNVLTTDPANPLFSIQTGKQRSKGVELDVSGTPARNWNLLLVYAFTQAQVTEDNDIPVGIFLPNAARHSGSVWTIYEIAEGPVRGLGFGAGVQAVSKRVADLFSDVILPGYAKVDATAFYRFRSDDRTSFRVSVNF